MDRRRSVHSRRRLCRRFLGDTFACRDLNDGDVMIARIWSSVMRCAASGPRSESSMAYSAASVVSRALVRVSGLYIGVSFLGGWFYVTCGGACVWCTYPDYWLSGSHVVWCWDRTGAHILSEHRPTCTVHAPHNQHPHAEHPTHQRHRVFAHPHLHSSPTHLIDQEEAAATHVRRALEDTCNTSHACSLFAGSTQMVLKPTRPDS